MEPNVVLAEQERVRAAQAAARARAFRERQLAEQRGEIGPRGGLGGGLGGAPPARPPGGREERQPDDDELDEPPVQPREEVLCRICYGGPDVGRLFSPCACRGSVGLVHVECLNAWRRASANPESTLRCDMCGERYRVERAEFADLLEDDRLVFAATSVLLLLITLVVGLVSGRAVLNLDAAPRFYGFVMWRPPWAQWRTGPFVDDLVGGVVIVGLVGALLGLYSSYTANPDHFLRQILPSIVMSLSQHGSPLFRLVAAAGLVYAAQTLHARLTDTCKQLLHEFGETVLAYRPAGDHVEVDE